MYVGYMSSMSYVSYEFFYELLKIAWNQLNLFLI